MTTETEAQNVEGSSGLPMKNKIAIGAVAAGIIGAWLVLMPGSDALAEKKVAAFIEKAEAESNGDVKIAYGDVSASLTSSTVSVSDIKLTEKDGKDVLEIDEVDLTAKGYVESESLPYLASISLSNIKILDGDMIQDLKKQSGIDYSERDIDVSLGYELKESDDTMSAQAKLGVSDVNEITLEATVEGVSDAWSVVQETYKANKGSLDFSREQGRDVGQKLRYAKLQSLKLTYDNDGEIETLMAHTAKENGLTLEEFKQQIPMAVDQYIQDKAVASEIKEFLADPDKIALSVNPESAIPFSELPMIVMSGMMGQTDAVIKKLNLRITAN